MSSSRPPVRVPWHTVVVAALTLGLLWLFFRNVQLADIWRAVVGADLGMIAAAIAATALSYLLRAWRWQALLAPIGHARLRTAFRTTVIGYTASFLLPGRVGEVLRPFLLAREEHLKATASFATIVVERLLDLSTVLLLFAGSLPFLTVDVGADVMAAGTVAAAVSLGALITLFVCAGHPERLGRWAGRLASRLPARVSAAATNVVQSFIEGLGVMRSPRQLLLAAAWSLPLWLTLAFCIWITSRAFGLTFSFPASFLVMMFLVVGVSAPTPGGVGSFHFFYLLAVTRFFHADPDTARAAALVLHAVSFVPMTLVGLVFMWQDGLTLGSLKSLRATARAAESS